jgi:hypothetical protein
METHRGNTPESGIRKSASRPPAPRKTGRTSESSEIEIEFAAANLLSEENTGETGHLSARPQQQ